MASDANSNFAYKYTGFWARFGAFIIDYVILAVVTNGLVLAIYGLDYYSAGEIRAGALIVSYFFQPFIILGFWLYRQATPGKMAVTAKIVDARTGEEPSFAQYFGRFLGYIVSSVPCGLGFLWVAWDDRKQSWHDKMAGTVVVTKVSRV
ncbi:RDD family protein [Halioxenophilus sp. WMMB6]|uniref:RDD family protein n=1 Tax=Halioxenophilus sp. WMMB6 TaxID=3073815 RepID=UPI00295F090F|nr:RDD family protein [Halioxenophilus sp. WMMB6]